MSGMIDDLNKEEAKKAPPIDTNQKYSLKEMGRVLEAADFRDEIKWTFEQAIMLRSASYLKGINGKLTFIVILIVLGIIVAALRGCGGL